MDIELWLILAAVVLLLLLSAFFSSVESAYFSLSRSVLDRLRESADPRARRVAYLMDDPRRLLASILTGNTGVNTAAAVIAALVAVRVSSSWILSPNLVVALEVIFMTAIILFFSELAPKLAAMRNPEHWALKSSLAVHIMRVLLAPFALPLAFFIGWISRLSGIESHSMMAMSEKEIRALIQVGHEHGALELEERQMLYSIFQFGDTIVREVMVPRIDIAAVEEKVPLDVLLDTVGSRGHSRIAVYRESVDNITGIIHAKDLLMLAQDP